jgi:hypothetical protein
MSHVSPVKLRLNNIRFPDPPGAWDARYKDILDLEGKARRHPP